jgi:hypothetical protein
MEEQKHELKDEKDARIKGEREREKDKEQSENE